MNHVEPKSSRRTALAGGAALLLCGLAKHASASLDEACCGGNGPPNVKKNGIGMTVSGGVSGSQIVQFQCPDKGMKGLSPNYYVFVPETGVTVVSYTGPGGNTLTSYSNITGFSGIVFVVERGYLLTLLWPPGVEPLASVRPATIDEASE